MSKQLKLAIDLQALINVQELTNMSPVDIMDYYNESGILFYSTMGADGDRISSDCVKVIEGDLDDKVFIDISTKEGRDKFDKLTK